MKKLILLIGLCILLMSGVVSASLNDAEIYYSFDNDNLIGSDPLDLSNNNYNGNNNGITTGNSGVLNEEFDWDGIDDSLDDGGTDFSNLNFGTNPFSIAFNINIDTIPTGTEQKAIILNGVRGTGGIRYEIFLLGPDVLGTTNPVMSFGFDDDSINDRIYSDTPISTNTDYHIVMTRATNGNINVYKNGALWFTDTIASNKNLNIPSSEFNIGYGGATDSYLDGSIDEFGIWGEVLDLTDVQTLYSLGNLYNPNMEYQESKYTLNIQNSWDNSSLSNFTAEFTNSTDITQITTTNGSIYYNYNELVNITIYDIPGHFNQTYTNYNTSTDLVAQTWQSEITINAKELISNTEIDVFNVTIDSVTREVTNGSTLYNISAGEYVITSEKGGYHSTNETNLIVDALDIKNKTLYFAPKKLTVNVDDYLTNDAIENFTIGIELIDGEYSYIENASEVDSLYNLYGINGTYNITIQSVDYETQSVLVNLTNYSQEITLKLYEANSVFVFIYDQDTGDLVEENVSVTLVAGETENEYSTTNGTLYLNLLDPATYNVSFVSTNYNRGTYILTVAPGSSQTLNAYLSKSNNTVTFEIQDASTGSLVDSAVVTIKRKIDDEWVVIETKITDITGKTRFSYVDDIKYQFQISKTDYITKEFSLDPILFDEYIIKINKDYNAEEDIDYSGIQIIHDPKSFDADTEYNLTFLFADPSGRFEYYGFNATYKTNTWTKSGTNAYGESLIQNLTFTDVSFGDKIYIDYYYKISTSDVVKTYSVSYFINTYGTGENTWQENKDKTHGLGVLERVLISVCIILFVVGASTMFGGEAIGSVVGLFMFGFLIAIGFLELWLGIISAIILFIILVWRSSY